MNYTISRKVGCGSFGTVYEAHDEAGRRYAAKVVEVDGLVARDLLRAQYQFLAGLSHPRIVAAVDFDARSLLGPMLVTEFVDGLDLREFVKTYGDGRLPEIAFEVLDALRYLHAGGKLHGDLKPENILVVETAEGPEIKLVDAGFDFGKGSRLPTLAGTLPYLAPEIIRNLPADGRSDLYSLGVTLYEVLTGECPFRGSTPGEILKQQLERIPPPPTKLRRSILPVWDEFIAGLTSKEPFSRYQDATHAALRLGSMLGRPSAFDAYLSLPRDIGRLGIEGEAKLVAASVEEASNSYQASGVLVCGERGSGIVDLLGTAEVTGKAAGLDVVRIALSPGQPALAQIVEAMWARFRTGGRKPAPGREQDAVGRSTVYAEILALLKPNGGDASSALLVVEGAEGMDAADLEALGRAARMSGRRVGLVFGHHTDGLASGRCPDAPGFDCINLEPLGGARLEAFLKRVFAVVALPEGFIEEVSRASGGNRRLVELVLSHMWDTGALRYSIRSDSVGLAWDKTSRIPASLREFAEERLGRLSPLALEITRLISASGGKLSAECLREFVFPSDPAPALRDLEHEGLVERARGGASLRLRLDGLSEIVPKLLPEAWLREASLRLASIVERSLGSQGERYGLGLLYLQGGDMAKAFSHLVAAGDYFASFSPRDAALAYSRALGCVSEDDATAEINERIGDMRLAVGDFDGALASFEAGSRMRPSSLRRLGWVEGLRGDTDRAVLVLTECGERATARGDLVEAARVNSDLGYVRSTQSRMDLAFSLLGQAKTFFEEAGMVFEVGIAANRIAIAAMRTGDTRQAVAAWRQALTYFENAGAKRHIGLAMMALGMCDWKEMDFARALESLRAALEIFDTARALPEKATCYQNQAVVLTDVGDLVTARSLAQEALELHKLLGERPAVTETLLALAAIAVETGNAEDAERQLADLDPPTLNAYRASLVKRYLAMAASIRGDSTRALGLADESYALASEASDTDGECRAMLARSELLLRFGRAREALGPALQALSGFGSAGSVLMANVAERVLGEAECLSGKLDEGVEHLLAARAKLEAASDSLHLARAHRGLAQAYSLAGDLASSEAHLRLACAIFRKRQARYDFALTLLDAGRVAGRLGSFIKARRCLAEAGRIFSTLGTGDLEKQVVDEMEPMGVNEPETRAVSSLSRISQTLNSSYDLTTVLNLAMDLAMEYLDAERGVLMLEDEESATPTTIVERKMDKESVEEAISISRSIVEAVRATREPVIARDATVDPRFRDSKSVRIHNVMSVMCVPLMRNERLLGLIYLDNRDVPSDFSSLEKAFVQAFANQVVLAIENARNVGRLYEDFADLKARAGEKYSYANIVGPGKAMQEVFRQVEKAAPSSISVLLSGESGTGKELIAGLLHELSPRREKPLVKVNCAAIHRELIEAELFGIEKNVATGVAPRSGFFERAGGGTVLLDEIGDMPLSTQTRVLRVLAEKEFERVGGSKVLRVDVRFVSATNQDLKALIERGLFRKDLYFRLNAMRIHLPPLRERVEDLPLLVERFLAKYATENSKPEMRISNPALAFLARYPWPGNVRELEKCIEHAVVVADRSEVRIEHFPREIVESRSEAPSVLASYGPGALPQAVRHLERDLIGKALRDAHGVKTVAATMLGIHESTLRKKIKELGIDRPIK